MVAKAGGLKVTISDAEGDIIMPPNTIAGSVTIVDGTITKESGT